MMQHIKRIIDSCETFDQAQTCLSFVEYPRPNIGPEEKQEILSWIRAKVQAIHSSNLDFHRQEMAKLRQERASILARD